MTLARDSVPFKEARASLWAKIPALLPSREEIEPGLEQMLSSSSAARSRGAEFPVPFFSDLLQALAAGRWVRVTYRSERRLSVQTLLPQRLSTNAGLWYCHAYSLEHSSVRLYRVDRLLSLEVLTEPPCVIRPAPKDWREDPAFPEACIRLTARGTLRLEHCTPLAARLQREADGSGWLRLHWNPDDYDWLARQLLSLGPEARIVAPEALRHCLLRMARHIIAGQEEEPAQGEKW